MGGACPRCGGIYTYLNIREVRGRRYVYAMHWNKEAKKYKACYLGPVEGYEYGERLNMIGLEGVMNQQRYISYVMSSIDNALEVADRLISSGEYEKAEKIVRELIEILREGLEKASEILKDIEASKVVRE